MVIVSIIVLVLVLVIGIVCSLLVKLLAIAFSFIKMKVVPNQSFGTTYC